ncbi:MAG: hypothetical protein UT08_C0005G0056 [Candidatus Woesebacteria bacterium GW2011_GWB1_38_8]|nr:MAG: hypothetical protein UT08_C0005G0056 [Candidatus Woesebacteria bacterium GW2011_GWB1_38_8]
MDSSYLAQAEINTNNGVATLQGLEGLFQNVLASALSIAGIALFIMLLWGGYQFMTAGGDPKKVSSAWSTLTYAIAGLILVVLSYLIIAFISSFTGAIGILNFRIFR